MILSDHEIVRLCREGMVTPFEDYLLNPASLDVRLGHNMLVEVEDTDKLSPITLTSCSKTTPFLLKPNEFVLTETFEMFNMPDDVCGQFALKSSLARAGFEHLMAGWIDPGFNSSVLTLEIKNARQYHAIPMWPGMRIGQIIFMRMASKPDVSYRDCGRYNSDKTVQESKGL